MTHTDSFTITTDRHGHVGGNVRGLWAARSGTNVIVGHGSDGSKTSGKLFGQADGTILVEGIITTP